MTRAIETFRIAVKPLVTLLLAGGATAVAAQSRPSLSALSDIVGVWQSDTTQGTSAVSQCVWTPQRGAVICEQAISSPQGARHAANFFTFDSATASYAFYVLTRPGATMVPVPLEIHDHVWIYGGKQSSPDGRYYRTVNDFHDSGSYTWRTETSADGKTWKPSGAHGRSKRVK